MILVLSTKFLLQFNWSYDFSPTRNISKTQENLLKVEFYFFGDIYFKCFTD